MGGGRGSLLPSETPPPPLQGQDANKRYLRVNIGLKLLLTFLKGAIYFNIYLYSLVLSVEKYKIN
jgi:hypothetical protein